MDETLYLVEVSKNCSIHFTKGTICMLCYTSERKDFKLITINDDFEISSYFGYVYLTHIKFLS